VIVGDQRNTQLHRGLLKPTPDRLLSCPVMLVITQSCLLLNQALKLHTIMSLSRSWEDKHTLPHIFDVKLYFPVTWEGGFSSGWGLNNRSGCLLL